jgi:sterol desaturase/sphingolipid hydroxylase (fatty acid hydroxylase superfamily)
MTQFLTPYLVQIVRSTLLLALMLAVFAPLEQLFAVRKAPLLHKGWTVDLGWYFVTSLAAIGVLGPPTALIAWAAHLWLPQAVTDAVGALPLWARAVLALVVGEIGFYWGHRLSHEIPFLWRFHAVHHSATHVTFLVNTRSHPVDIVVSRILGLVLLYATGLANPLGPHPALIPALVLFVGSFWSFFIHANLRVRLGPLEQVLTSPAYHHWHHTYEDHKDRNYASMLPVIDRVFGTFYLPRHWPEAYGTSTPMPATLGEQLLEPFAPTGT